MAEVPLYEYTHRECTQARAPVGQRFKLGLNQFDFTNLERPGFVCSKIGGFVPRPSMSTQEWSANPSEAKLEIALLCKGGTGTSAKIIHAVDAAFRQPPVCLDPASCKAHSRKQRLKHFSPHNPHSHLAATFRAVSAEKGQRLNQAGSRRFRSYAMRGEMSGEAQNSGRKPHPAPSQRTTAAAALPKTQAAHIGPDRARS